MIRYLLTFSCLALPANAQTSAFCQEVWLSRSTILDRAGQCFGTPLGQAVFDNSNCIGEEVRLNPLDADQVRVAQEIEAWAECEVDTNIDHLLPNVLPFHARLRDLFTVPVRNSGEVECTGYLGQPLSLHTGTSTSMTEIGTAQPSQTLVLSHQPVRGGWQYLEVLDTSGADIAHGWAQGLPEDLETVCASISAG